MRQKRVRGEADEAACEGGPSAACPAHRRLARHRRRARQVVTPPPIDAALYRRRGDATRPGPFPAGGPPAETAIEVPPASGAVADMQAQPPPPSSRPPAPDNPPKSHPPWDHRLPTRASRPRSRRSPATSRTCRPASTSPRVRRRRLLPSIRRTTNVNRHFEGSGGFLRGRRHGALFWGLAGHHGFGRLTDNRTVSHPAWTR